MFGDLAGLKKLGQESADLCKQIKDFEEELFAKWVDKIKKGLSDAQ